MSLSNGLVPYFAVMALLTLAWILSGGASNRNG
jgi:hypothetical protein